jgi:polysaccharide export outer membrane protein
LTSRFESVYNRMSFVSSADSFGRNELVAENVRAAYLPCEVGRVEGFAFSSGKRTVKAWLRELLGAFCGVLIVAACIGGVAGCASNADAVATPAAQMVQPSGPPPTTVPREEEDARLAWFKAENHISPATEKDFTQAVALFQQGKFAEAKRLFDNVSAAGRVGEQTTEEGPAEVEGAPVRAPYRISAGDTLNIQVTGHAELSRSVTVRSDGMFSYQLIGQVEAVGKTIPELTQEISTKLSTYIKNPQVTVYGESLKPNVAVVLGAVTHPGEYQVTDDTRLWNLIARAGGIVVTGATKEGTADLAGAYIVRAGKVLPINFERLFVRGDAKHNIIVHPGDFVYIPAVRPASSDTVTVIGAVQDPGNVRYHKGMKLAEAIAEAGGIFIGSADVTNLDIADYSRAFLARENRILPVDFKRLLVDGDMSHNVELKPGDVINIPTARDNRIYVLGEVGFPREVVYGTDITFAQALASAGGLTLAGQRGAVYHVRGSLTNPQVTRIDALAILEGKQKDFLLARNDIIYASPTALTEVSFIMSQIIPGLTATEQARGFRHGYR